MTKPEYISDCRLPREKKPKQEPGKVIQLPGTVADEMVESLFPEGQEPERLGRPYKAATYFGRVLEGYKDQFGISFKKLVKGGFVTSEEAEALRYLSRSPEAALNLNDAPSVHLISKTTEGLVALRKNQEGYLQELNNQIAVKLLGALIADRDGGSLKKKSQDKGVADPEGEYRHARLIAGLQREREQFFSRRKK